MTGTPIADSIHSQEHTMSTPSLHDVSRVIAQLGRNQLIERLAQTGLGERLSGGEVDAIIHVVHAIESDAAHADELTPEQFADQALAWKTRNPQAFDAFIIVQAQLMHSGTSA